MAKKPPIGLIIGGIVVVGGVAALAMGGRKASAKTTSGGSVDTKQTSGGPGSPVLDNKGQPIDPPQMDLDYLQAATGVGWDLLNALGYAGPFPPGTSVEGFDGPDVHDVQIKRFQAHYNMISKLGGQTLAGVKVPTNMGSLDVNGRFELPTLRGVLTAGFSGGPDYTEKQLRPYIKGESDLLMDTAWLDMVLAACEQHGLGVCSDWIREGAQPTWGMVES